MEGDGDVSGFWSSEAECPHIVEGAYYGPAART